MVRQVTIKTVGSRYRREDKETPELSDDGLDKEIIIKSFQALICNDSSVNTIFGFILLCKFTIFARKNYLGFCVNTVHIRLLV
mgnify:FL=1|jgi:hypothetical protein